METGSNSNQICDQIRQENYVYNNIHDNKILNDHFEPNYCSHGPKPDS